MMETGALVRGVGGLLLVALGGYVASLRPRSPENLAFAAFCALSGAGFAAALVPRGALDAAIATAAGALFAGAGIALARVAIAFPRPLAEDERPLARNAALLCVALGLVQAAAYVSRGLADPDYPTAALRAGAIVEDLGLTTFRTAAWYGALLAALRLACAHGRSVDEHRALALLCVALALYPAAHGPDHVIDGDVENTVIGAATSALLLAIVAALLRATATIRSKALARWAAWILTGTAAAAIVHRAWWWGSSVAPTSVSIVAMFATLTYAVLRHQLLGMDVKVRLAISRSTIAAAFVAAFFLASEGAQLLFGGGNEWVGLLGAGALVFALAPLQRAAERLAERAVPPTSGASAPGPRGDPRRDAYKAALRAALADGALTREKELHLADLQHHLGLLAREAVELRHAVEAEREGVRGAA